MEHFVVSFETQIKVVHHLVLFYTYFQKTKSFGGFRTVQYQDSGRLYTYNNLTVEPTADHHKYGFSIQSKSFRWGNICEDLLDTFWWSETSFLYLQFDRISGLFIVQPYKIQICKFFVWKFVSKFTTVGDLNVVSDLTIGPISGSWGIQWRELGSRDSLCKVLFITEWVLFGQKQCIITVLVLIWYYLVLFWFWVFIYSDAWLTIRPCNQSQPP